MTFNLLSFFVTTETDVIKVITRVKSDITIAERDIVLALGWVAKQAPTVASDLVKACSIVEALGVASNPDVAAAVVAANLAVAALNAFSAAYKTGATDKQTVINGYVAIKQASSAVSIAVAAAASSTKK